MSEWISVKDRLPEDNAWVLVFDPKLHLHVTKVKYFAERSAGAWRFGDDDKYYKECDITHWMPYCGDPKEPIMLNEIVNSLRSLRGTFHSSPPTGVDFDMLLITVEAMVIRYAKENNISLEEK